MDNQIADAVVATSESASVEFKAQFDTSSNVEWIEIIKDIVAMANSGGGIIVFGADSLGRPTGKDVSHVFRIDPADITNKVKKYTSQQFDGFEMRWVEKEGFMLVALKVLGVAIPMVFEKPGTYHIANGNQGRGFSQGSAYFRHGAKSEPGNSEDLRQALEREVDRRRRLWLENIRKVVEAPPESEVILVPEGEERDSAGHMDVRLVDDPTAVAVQQMSPDLTHPYRQTELIQVVNERLGSEVVFNSYDVLCLKVVHKVHEESQFCYQPQFGSPQYSSALVDWIVDQYSQDNDFFEINRREKYQLKPPKQRVRSDSR